MSKPLGKQRGAGSPAARPDAIRRHNLALILGLVHRDGELTRAQLTQRLGVSRSTVGALVADLTRLGLVEERVPNGGDRVGRPSYVVGPDPSGPFVVAVDVDVTHVTSAAVGIGGIEIARSSVSTGAEPASPGEVADLVAAAVTELRVAAGRSVLGVGVSVPGTVDKQTRSVAVAPNLGWRGVPLGDLITERLGPEVAVWIGNDAACPCSPSTAAATAAGAPTSSTSSAGSAWAPASSSTAYRCWVGTAEPARSATTWSCRTALSVTAASAAAWRPSSATWPCCPWRVGGPPTEQGVAAVFADARTGDPTALAAVLTVAEWLGQAVGNLVNTLNPQRIILGGSLSGVLELARPEIEEALEHYAFDPDTLSSVLPHFGVDSALVGASELAFVTSSRTRSSGRRSPPADEASEVVSAADRHGLDAVDEAERAVVQVLARHRQRQLGEPPGERRERHTQLHPGQLGTDATVEAVAEGEVEPDGGSRSTASSGAGRAGRGWPPAGGRSTTSPWAIRLPATSRSCLAKRGNATCTTAR